VDFCIEIESSLENTLSTDVLVAYTSLNLWVPYGTFSRILGERLPTLSACKVLQQRALDNPKIEVFCSTMAEGISAAGDLRNLSLKNIETDESWNLEVSGVFIHVGLDPQTEYLKDVVELDS